MRNPDERKLSRFNGKESGDYNLCRSRAETAPKGRKIWTKLQDSACAQESIDEKASVLVAALGDSAFRLCISNLDDLIETLKLLDELYASSRASIRIIVLTIMFSKRSTPVEGMPRYVDDFESLFDQLRKICSNMALPETFKAPLYLFNLGTNSLLESSITAQGFRNVEDLSLKTLIAGLIQEFKRKRVAEIQGKKETVGSGRRKMERIFKGALVVVLTR